MRRASLRTPFSGRLNATKRATGDFSSSASLSTNPMALRSGINKIRVVPMISPLGSTPIRRFSTPKDRQATLDLLREIHTPEMTDFYLESFKHHKGPAFCLVKVGGEVVEDELAILCASCSLLLNAGLKPVVVHGGGPQMNKALKEKNVEPEYVGGHRVTNAETLTVAVSTFEELNRRVVDAFTDMGTPAKGFPRGVFLAKQRSGNVGFVGDVVGVNETEIVQALERGEIPVLTSVGIDPDSNQLLNINADVAARELAVKIQPMRIVFTSAKGGWLDDDAGEVIPTIDLKRQYADLASRDYTGRQGTLLKLNEIKSLLDGLPADSAVAITRASSLTKEFFTHSGGGTLFLKGEDYSLYDGLGSVDNQTDDFKALTKDVRVPNGAVVVVNDSQTACAVVSTGSSGELAVLEEFIVSPSAAGSGAKEALLERVLEAHPKLAFSFESGKGDDFVVRKADATIVDHASSKVVGWFYDSQSSTPGWSAKLAERAFFDRGSSPRSSTSDPVDSTSSRSFSTSGSQQKVKVGLLGARGYVGREVVQLLSKHPHMELVVASSRAMRGETVVSKFDITPSSSSSSVDPNLKFTAVEPEDLHNHANVDVWILALPNGLAPKFVEKMSPSQILIDLGADYRFDDEWDYGLVERPGTREVISKSTRISNPGCYATGLQLGLLPLLPHLRLNSVPTVFGISGYSGAGTNPSKANDVELLADNILPYKLTQHIHENECSRHLSRRVAFSPHVGQFFRGITLTLSTNVLKNPEYSNDFFCNEFDRFYAKEKLVGVTSSVPLVKDIANAHGAVIGGFDYDPENDRLALVSTIDNLLKGAATQAMQNLNLALGFDEFESIEIKDLK